MRSAAMCSCARRLNDETGFCRACVGVPLAVAAFVERASVCRSRLPHAPLTQRARPTSSPRCRAALCSWARTREAPGMSWPNVSTARPAACRSVHRQPSAGVDVLCAVVEQDASCHSSATHPRHRTAEQSSHGRVIRMPRSASSCMRMNATPMPAKACVLQHVEPRASQCHPSVPADT